MEKWKNAKVEELFFLGRGRVISDREIQENLGKYPVYSSQTSNNGCFGEVNFYEFEGEYITWTTDGANAGKVFFRNGRFNCTNVCGTLKVKNANEIDTKYFAYLIDRLAFRHVAVVGNNKLMNNVMAQIKLYYPSSKSEQAAIASILSRVDEAIEAVQRSIAAAERLKKSLMQNLLTGRMKPDGTFRKDDEFYIDEKLGRVPKGWEVRKVKQCFILKNGKGKTTSNLKITSDKIYAIPVYGGNGVTGYYNKPLLTKETIIIGRVGEYCGNVFKTPKLSWVTDNAMFISKVLISEYDIDFFTTKLNSLKFKHYRDSTGQPKITQGSIESMLFAYPQAKSEQSSIKDKLYSVNNGILFRQQKIATLERLKKSLMQNLLTGKVRVEAEKIEKIINK